MSHSIDSSRSTADYSYSREYNIRKYFLEYALCIRSMLARAHDPYEGWKTLSKISSYIEKIWCMSYSFQSFGISLIFPSDDLYVFFIEEFHYFFFFYFLTLFLDLFIPFFCSIQLESSIFYSYPCPSVRDGTFREKEFLHIGMTTSCTMEIYEWYERSIEHNEF